MIKWRIMKKILFALSVLPLLSFSGIPQYFEVSNPNDAGNKSLRAIIHHINTLPTKPHSPYIIGFNLPEPRNITLNNDIIIAKPLRIEGFSQRSNATCQRTPCYIKIDKPIEIQGKGELLIQSPGVMIEGLYKKQKLP